MKYDEKKLEWRYTTSDKGGVSKVTFEYESTGRYMREIIVTITTHAIFMRIQPYVYDDRHGGYVKDGEILEKKLTVEELIRAINGVDKLFDFSETDKTVSLTETDADLVDAAADFIRDFGPPKPDGSPADSAADVDKLRSVVTKIRKTYAH